MIGLIEILLSILVFGTIWFFIFRIKILKENKKRLKDIAKKIDKQNNKFFYDGKEVNLKKELGLSNSPPKVQKKSKTPISKPKKNQTKPKKNKKKK